MLKKAYLLILCFFGFSSNLYALKKINKHNFNTYNTIVKNGNISKIKYTNLKSEQIKILKNFIKIFKLKKNSTYSLKIVSDRKKRKIKYFTLKNKKSFFKAIYISKYKMFYLESNVKRFNDIYTSSLEVLKHFSKTKDNFKICHPLKYRKISSPYNLHRHHPILKRNVPHRGIDFVNRKGTKIVSVAPGKVIYKGRHGSYGKVVRIRHKLGYITEYAHLNGYSSKIRVGSNVKEKQVIGYLGNTGRSTGPHLHFGIKKNGRFYDPNLFFKKANKKRVRLTILNSKFNRNWRLKRNVKKKMKTLDRFLRKNT